MRTNQNGERLKTFSYQDMVDSIENPQGKQTIINGATEEERKKAEAEREDPHAGLKAFLIIAFFIGAIISMAVFAQIDKVLCIATLGLVFFVIGTIAVMKVGISLDSLPILIMPVGGALMIAIPAMIVYNRETGGGVSISQWDIIRLIVICFAVIGLLMLTVPLTRHCAKMSRCSQTIMAKCIYEDIHFGSHKDGMGRTHHYNIYCPTWQYELGDFIFVTREGVFGRNAPAIGDICEIRYDPNDPSYIYRPNIKQEISEMIAGAIFLTISLTAFFVM